MTTSLLAHVQSLPLGASRHSGDEWAFVLWAPSLERVSVHLLGSRDRLIQMEKDERGYHFAVVDEMARGTRYFYRFDDGRELPDPASRFQPEGVHGPSEIV